MNDQVVDLTVKVVIEFGDEADAVALVQIEPDWNLKLLAPAVAEDVAAEEAKECPRVDGVQDCRWTAIATGRVEGRVLRQQAGRTEQKASEAAIIPRSRVLNELTLTVKLLSTTPASLGTSLCAMRQVMDGLP